MGFFSLRQLLKELDAHNPAVKGLRKCNDQVLSTGTDGLVKVRCMTSYELIRSVRVHGYAVKARDSLGGWIPTSGKMGLARKCMWIEFEGKELEIGWE